MATVKKITQRELIQKIRDLNTSDAELAQYFIVDEGTSGAFSPNVIANPKYVEDNGLEGAFFLNTLNGLARARRNRLYRKRVKDWTGVKVVAEGDSWFQYPLILKDTIDQLNDLEHFEYAIYGLSEAGDLLSNIMREDEITEALDTVNPDVFLISGGGNDMVGDGRMAKMVHKYAANRKVENYPNDKFDQFLSELEDLYRGLFSRLLASRPHLKIICHGYDKAIPDNGKWLGKPLAKKGIKDQGLQRDIVAVMISRFNQRLKEITTDYAGSVYHVDCQDLIGQASDWHDELHPKNEGYLKVAQKFDQVIKVALSENAASPSISLDTVATDSKIPLRLAKMSKLDHQDFLNMVVKRAETIMQKDIAVPKTQYERKQLEQDISDHFEKIHKERNFLPSSFLEDGVRCAQAVCRISTDESLGSGFLIGSRHFIMTNNHVIPDKDTARTSIAEFDYDEDNILYRVQLQPDTFFITDVDLDFTIVACDSAPLPLEIEPIPLLADPHTVTRGERVNIIQHPRGRKKEISLHDNKVNYVYDIGIRYTADTEAGSSGSPVFNNDWNLVALHHAGWKGADDIATNEGIRIKTIVDYLIENGANEGVSQINRLLETIVDSSDVVSHAIANRASSRLPAPGNQAKSGKTVTVNLNGNISELTINIDA